MFVILFSISDEFFIAANMVTLKKKSSSLSYANALLEELKSETFTKQYNVSKIVSGDENVFVHSALLRNVSVFLRDILSSSNCCEDNVFILPSSPKSTLDNLVTLLYTGQIFGLSRCQADQVVEIAKGLHIDITKETKDTKISSDALVTSHNHDEPEPEDENYENYEKQLKLKTTTVNKHGSLILSFPISRSNRQQSSKDTKEDMVGFHGRVQKEFNGHPVGRYMGPYDQNQNLELKIQLPHSNLDFKSYTEFQHDGNKCYDLGLKSYDKYEDLDKIDAYRIVGRSVNSSENDTNSDDPECDGKIYTCQLGKCKIPCPCPQCHLDQSQCLEHKIKHESLFNEKKHAISIKSSEEFCLDESFSRKVIFQSFLGFLSGVNNVREICFYITVITLNTMKTADFVNRLGTSIKLRLKSS